MGVTSNPRILAQLLAARGEVGVDPWRILIAGQIGTDGNATSGTFYQDIQDLTNSQLTNLFGTKGEFINRILRTLDVANGNFSVWAVGLTEAAGTQATADLAVVGTATQDSTLRIKAIDEQDFEFTVAVTNGDSANDIAVAIDAEFDSLVSTFSRFPATNSIAADTVTLTANDDGTLPNKWTVDITGIPTGITINGSSEKERVQFSSGATDPSTATIFDNAGTTRFHTVLWPWETDYDAVNDFLSARNVADNAFLQGVAMIGLDGTEAGIRDAINGTTVLNSFNLIFGGNRTLSSVSGIITPPDWRMAEFAAIEGLRQTEGVPISQYVTVTTPLDVVGGPGLASLAYYNTPLANTDVADPVDLFDDQEQDDLKDDGYTIIGVNETRTSAIMGQVVSTYKFNAKGDPDVSFKYLNYIRTGYLALELFFNTLKSDYSQFRLTDGGLVGGRAITNREQIEGRCLDIYRRLSGPSFTLTQAGTDAEQYFSDNLTVTVDVANGSVTISGALPIVTQVREITITFQLSFSIGG